MTSLWRFYCLDLFHTIFLVFLLLTLKVNVSWDAYFHSKQTFTNKFHRNIYFECIFEHSYVPVHFANFFLKTFL